MRKVRSFSGRSCCPARVASCASSSQSGIGAGDASCVHDGIASPVEPSLTPGGSDQIEFSRSGSTTLLDVFLSRGTLRVPYLQSHGAASSLCGPEVYQDAEITYNSNEQKLNCFWNTECSDLAYLLRMVKDMMLSAQQRIAVDPVPHETVRGAALGTTWGSAVWPYFYAALAMHRFEQFEQLSQAALLSRSDGIYRPGAYPYYGERVDGRARCSVQPLPMRCMSVVGRDVRSSRCLCDLRRWRGEMFGLDVAVVVDAGRDVGSSCCLCVLRRWWGEIIGPAVVVVVCDDGGGPSGEVPALAPAKQHQWCGTYKCHLCTWLPKLRAPLPCKVANAAYARALACIWQALHHRLHGNTTGELGASRKRKRKHDMDLYGSTPQPRPAGELRDVDVRAVLFLQKGCNFTFRDRLHDLCSSAAQIIDSMCYEAFTDFCAHLVAECSLPVHTVCARQRAYDAQLHGSWIPSVGVVIKFILAAVLVEPGEPPKATVANMSGLALQELCGVILSLTYRRHHRWLKMLWTKRTYS